MIKMVSREKYIFIDPENRCNNNAIYGGKQNYVINLLV